MINVTVHKNASNELYNLFDIADENCPVFKDITKDTYRQLETGIYNSWGRKLNITPRILNENGVWTGEYKDWSHLQEIKIRSGYFEYLNCTWLFKDLRPNKIHDCYCKEATVFDKKCIVIQEFHHDYVSAKILTNDEDLKIHIESILQYKPMNVVPIREVKEINELEYQGLQFGSSQLKINVNTAEDEFDKEGTLITNLDHFDNYVYEVYDSLRNLYKHINITKQKRAIEQQCIWLEEWITRPLTNDLESIIPYMTDKVVTEFKKYTYKNKDVYDRQACGSFLFEETKMKKFSIEDMDYVIIKGKRMDKICSDLDIPISIGWDIWKLLNFEVMKQIIQELYEEYPL